MVICYIEPFRLGMPRPDAKLCFQKQELLDAFLQAVHEVVELQDQQMTHFVEGGGGFERIDLAIEAARKKRDTARRLYVLHLSAHGC